MTNLHVCGPGQGRVAEVIENDNAFSFGTPEQCAARYPPCTRVPAPKSYGSDLRAILSQPTLRDQIEEKSPAVSTRRYLIELAYRGTEYAGWQRQPNALSVEECVDSSLSTVLGEQIKIVGCGRTDRGVHASFYAAHFDFSGQLPPRLIGRLNRMLPEDIALRALYRVPETTHARFSATGRGYVYRIAVRKDPFRPTTVSSLPNLTTLDRGMLEKAAAILPEYGAFAPFCKTKSDVFTMNCVLTESRWEFTEHEWRYPRRGQSVFAGYGPPDCRDVRPRGRRKTHAGGNTQSPRKPDPTSQALQCATGGSLSEPGGLSRPEDVGAARIVGKPLSLGGHNLL